MSARKFNFPVTHPLGVPPSAGPLELRGISDLQDLVPGSSRRNWFDWTRRLVEQGVLVKRGKRWLGRRAEIEAALLGQLGAKS